MTRLRKTSAFSCGGWSRTALLLTCIGIAAIILLALVWRRESEPEVYLPETDDGNKTVVREASQESKPNMEKAVTGPQTQETAGRSESNTVSASPVSKPEVSEPDAPIPALNPVAAPAEIIAYVRDGNRPLKTRRDFINQLAKQSTPDAWRGLRAVADADIYLSHAAIKAMYGAKCADRETIASYLENKLLSPDPRVARAAIDSYARTIGAEAVKPISETIKKGRETDHAFFDHVAEAGYTALGALAEPQAVPFLASESLKTGKDLDMGSTIVKALSNIAVPEAHKAILQYADHLEERLPEKPMERAYYRKKIAEARALAKQMGS